jgi:hypothetical protein
MFRRFATLLFAALPLLLSCSENELRSLAVGPSGPEGDASGEAPPSPWDDLDPGTLPDEYFVVAWHDTTGIAADSLVNRYDVCSPDDLDMSESMPQLRFDVIDVNGQIIQALAPPAGWGYEPAATTLWPHEITLDSVGDGRFAATWQTQQDDGRFHRGGGRIWLGDPAAGAQEHVFSWGEGNGLAKLVLPLRDEEIELGFEADELHPAIDPGQPDTVWVARGRRRLCDFPVRTDETLLLAVDYRQAGAEPVAYTGADLLPPEFLTPTGSVIIDGLRATVEEGRTWLAMDITWYDEYSCLNGVLQHESSPLALAFAPDTGERRWVWEKPWDRARLADYTPSRGEALLYLDEEWWFDAPRFDLVRPGEAPIVVEPEGLCGVAGPILDAAGPTFLYSTLQGPTSSDWAATLVVSHAGADVWSIDSFRSGFSPRSFYLRDVTAL